jgi:hypothetical protein
MSRVPALTHNNQLVAQQVAQTLQQSLQSLLKEAFQTQSTESQPAGTKDDVKELQHPDSHHSEVLDSDLPISIVLVNIIPRSSKFPCQMKLLTS